MATVPTPAPEEPRSRPAPPAPAQVAWWPLLIAAGVCLIGMHWQGGYDLNLGDEGFLWYGAQRVLAGELPLRDFQAYDPGRYFWSAAWMRLLGSDGIGTLRLGNALLAAVTVAIATWTVASGAVRPSRPLVLASGLIFALWMVPSYKVSDSFALVLQMLALTRIVQQPTLGRWFQVGLCWGVAAMIGINHALYGAIAGLLAFLYLKGAPRVPQAMAAASTGAIAGYSPLLALHAAAPGFTAGFLDSIRRLFEYGETNQALPFPSPLGFLQVPRMGYLMAATETLGGLLFLGVPLLWLFMAWRLRGADTRASVPAVIPAALILGLPYAHYAYSRADPLHVAVSILPVVSLVLALGLQAPLQWRRLVFAAAFLFSLIFTAHMQPAYYRLRGQLAEAVTVKGERLSVRPEIAAAIRATQVAAEAARGGQFFAGPYSPGAYAVARRKSPVWEIYMLFPATTARQQAEIQLIKSAKVRHALISDARGDGRRDLGLAQTHPLLLAYLRKCLPNARTLSSEPRLVLLSGDLQGCA